MLLAIAPLWWDRELQSSLQTLGLWWGRDFVTEQGSASLAFAPSQGSRDSQALGQPVSRAYIYAQLQRAVRGPATSQLPQPPGGFYKYRFLGPAENQVFLEQML